MTVRILRNTITPKIKAVIDDIDDLPKEALQVWKKNTPKKTGNAKRKTTLKKDTIHANYDYAQPLDDGWSKKKPQGMSKPTIDYIKKRLRKIIRK